MSGACSFLECECFFIFWVHMCVGRWAQDGRYNLVFIHQIADVLDREVFRRDRVPEETLFEMSQRLEPRNARKEDIL